MPIGSMIHTLSTDPFWDFAPMGPMDSHLLAKFRKKFSLPEDFSAMLSLTNGFTLSMGDYQFYSVSQMLEINVPNNGFRPNILQIGTFQDLALVIDLGKSHTKEYLYVGPTCSTEPFTPAGTITDFLRDVLQAHGESIPRWSEGWSEGEDFGED